MVSDGFLQTRLPQREGKLKKLNRHGYWQARYFVVSARPTVALPSVEFVGL